MYYEVVGLIHGLGFRGAGDMGGFLERRVFPATIFFEWSGVRVNAQKRTESIEFGVQG